MIPSEIHLFILWSKVGRSREAVLQRICAEFEVLQVFCVCWTPSLFSSNLSRFYGQSLPAGCDKEESCGIGPPTLVVVRDHRPNYAIRETTKGRSLVNTRTFDLKSFYRSPAGGLLPIHATDTQRETSHDLMLLLGVSAAYFEQQHTEVWNGQVKNLRQDIVGAPGWNSIEELFAVFNETLDYVVLRNFECLPERYSLDAHGDIDLLVGSYVDACLVANAVPVFHEPGRVHCTVAIRNEAIPFDFRYVTDGYFDASWQQQVLESRTLLEAGFYVPDLENHFFTLFYHAFVHKPRIAPDYIERLLELAKLNGLQVEPSLFTGDAEQIRAFLLKFMNKHGYRFTQPKDPTVYFRSDIALRKSEGFIDRLLPWRPTTEEQVLPLLKGHAPISNGSDERLLSPDMANLLRPFQSAFEKKSVLVLGRGLGVLTRFLGENGANVTALESSWQRAQVAKESYRDMQNVCVVCDNLMAFDTDQRFDFVTLIGVLEHAHRFTQASDPVAACLERSRSFLKPNGILVLAIENQLGLKYFNGCDEEHVGAAYYGLHGLYRKDEPTTFGRAALEGKLGVAGLPHHQFFYPFPDYKLPQVILSDTAFSTPDFDAAALLAGMASGNAEGEFHPNFHENLTWRPIIDNGLLPQLANSFLIFAAATEDALGDFEGSWLACSYTSRRIPAYATETRFTRSSGPILVKKRRLYLDILEPKSNLPAGRLLHQADTVCEYAIGRPYLLELQQRLGRGEGVAEVTEWAAPWFDLLLANSEESESGAVLQGGWIDAIPQNFIREVDGNLRRIDDEWVIEGHVQLAWVVVRGLVNSLGMSPISDGLLGVNLSELVTRITAGYGINLSDADFNVFRENEAVFRSVVYGCDMKESWGQTASTLGKYPACHLIPALGRNHHNDVVAELVGEIARIKSTVSWQITKPLRFFSFLFRRARQAFHGSR